MLKSGFLAWGILYRVRIIVFERLCHVCRNPAVHTMYTCTCMISVSMWQIINEVDMFLPGILGEGYGGEVLLGCVLKLPRAKLYGNP